jgi:methionyl-tRNA formyltransferase
MKIAFMGTPDFAVPSLNALYAAGHDVCCVFTQPDRPKNRGMKLVYSPVKTAADGKSPIYQPETLKDGAAADILRRYNPELIVVVAYGKILPRGILELPPLGCVNIHASLLPKYRGAAPIQRAVINGEKTTGVTSMYMAAGLDTGDIIMSASTDIGEDETSGDLFARLSDIGATLLINTIDAISRGDAPRTAQNDDDATYAPPLTREEAVINWLTPPREVVRLIHGMNPWPVARTRISGEEIKVFDATYENKKLDAAPGDIISAGKNGIEIAATGGSVTIKSLQAPGGKRMSSSDYLRGHPICL